MDPLSAIGLASNILQFIEFGVNFCAGIHEVANSATGWTQDNAHLAATAEDLREAANGLSTNLKGNGKYDAELVKLAAQCTNLSTELMKILSKLKVKKGEPLLSSVRAMWKSTQKEKKVAIIEKRLAEYRAQIVLRLNIMLYDEQSPIKAHLKRIEQQAIDLGNRHGMQMRAQHDQLKEIIKRMATIQPDDNGDTLSLVASHDEMRDIRTTLTSLHSSVHQIPRENEILRTLYFPSMFCRDDTIDPAVGNTYRWVVGEDESSESSYESDSQRLTHESPEKSNANNNREYRDLEPAEGTVNIVFQQNAELDESEIDSRQPPEIAAACSRIGAKSEEDNDDTQRLDSEISSHYLKAAHEEESSSRQEVASRFVQFLLHEHSTFLIYGKAGSGKSTLMKYLADSSNVAVRQHLDRWKSSCRLLSVSVFFWSAGDRLQRSLEGLYRSILYQTLSQCPELATKRFKNTLGLSAWQGIRLPLLKKAMDTLIHTLNPEQYKLCLFIDGLDEYEGDSMDQRELVNSIRNWSEHDNVKVICSARPHQEYMNEFTNRERSVALHEFTRGDILEYALTNFRESSILYDCPGSSSILALANEIVTLAEGVFLWAYLIVRSLSQKMPMYSIEKLQEILHATPRNLDSLFDQMLDAVDPVTQEQTEKFLLLAAHNPYDNSLNALSFSWMEELENPEFPFEYAMCCYSDGEIARRLDLVQKQIRGLTRGMLEARSSTLNRVFETHAFFNKRMYFFHRTFRDYLLARWHDKPAPSFETYVRISLAEVKFSCTMDLYQLEGSGFEHLNIIKSTLWWLRVTGVVLPVQYCEEMEHIYDSYEKLLKCSIQDQETDLLPSPVLDPALLAGEGLQESLSDLQAMVERRPFSMLSFLASYPPTTSSYLTKRIKEFPTAQGPSDKLTSALIAASIPSLASEFLPYFMEKGVTPSSLSTIWLFDDGLIKSLTIPAWLVVLAIYTMGPFQFQRSPDNKPHQIWRKKIWRMIEHYLRFGADPSVIFLVSPTDEEQFDKRYMDISQLAEHDQPENIQSLRQLLGRTSLRVGRWWDTAANIVSTWTSQQQQPNYVETTCKKYSRATQTEVSGTFRVLAVMTKSYRVPNNFFIQIW